jgi:hypothetical protein
LKHAPVLGGKQNDPTAQNGFKKMMTTMTTVQNTAEGGLSTAERKLNAETQLRRNLAITDSVRERVRTKLIDVPIEDSPVKRERSRTKDQDEEV